MNATSVSAASTGVRRRARQRVEFLDGKTQPQRRRLVGIGHAPGQCGVEDHRAGAALPGDVGQTGALLAHPDRHRHRAQAQQREQHEHEFGPVVDEHQHTLAGAHAWAARPAAMRAASASACA